MKVLGDSLIAASTFVSGEFGNVMHIFINFDLTTLILLFQSKVAMCL